MTLIIEYEQALNDSQCLPFSRFKSESVQASRALKFVLL